MSPAPTLAPTLAPTPLTSATRAALASALEAITEAQWLALARELIPAGQPRAENPLDPDMPHGHEEGIALLVAARLRDYGLGVELVAKRPGRPNVIGTLAGHSGGPTLILNDHLDTYPAGDPAEWTKTGGNPFNPTREGDHLYARGTSDTRGNLACTLLAVKALLGAGLRPRGTLKCVYTVDEEKNGPDGSIFLLDEWGLKGDLEITCEPTGWTQPDGRWGMSIATSNSGHFLVELEVIGRQGHLWRPDTAVNPIDQMMALLGTLQTLAFTHEPPATYGGTPPRVTVLRIAGGVPREMQFTPGRCTAVLGLVGLVPGMTQDSVMADLQTVLDRAAAADPQLQATVRPYPQALFVSATQEQSPSAQPVAALAAAYEQVMGRQPECYRKNAFNDTIRFSERGIPAVTFGPGEDGWPPMNEYIRIEKSVAATRILALALVDLLGFEAT
jgi:acetylornithine deacetylase/succinyl-diaminopimelate desuccinylase-like protein